MCGRYLLTAPVDALAVLFGFQGRPNLAPRWNIAPTQAAAVIHPTGGTGRELAFLRWGIVPPWSKSLSGGPPLINARGETVAQKPAFREAFRKGRCIAPADGFYEWRGKGKAKQAYFIKPAKSVGFAAISATWRAPDGEVIDSFALVTTEATGPIAKIHHRAPVVIPLDKIDEWMTAAPVDALELIRPPPEDLFQLIEVDSRVGNVREDDAGLIAPKPIVEDGRASDNPDDQMNLF